jgi:hypothetical protein
MPNFISNVKKLLSSGLNAIAHEDNPQPSPPGAESIKAGHELKDANVLGLSLAALGIIITGVVIQLILGLSFSSLKHQRMNLAQSHQTPPADFLEGADPDQHLADYRAQMKHILSTYAWVDREKKIVRIPIEKAMERLAHEK